MSNNNQNFIAILALLVAIIAGFPGCWYFFKDEISPHFQWIKIEKRVPVNQNI